jgi:hypothetical protein
VANEAVAAPVHRLDKARPPGVIPQRLAQLAHADGQYHLAHRRLRPEGLEQGRLDEQLAWVFHQISEEGKGFWPQDTAWSPYHRRSLARSSRTGTVEGEDSGGIGISRAKLGTAYRNWPRQTGGGK